MDSEQKLCERKKEQHCACLLPQHRACAYVSKEKKWLWGNDTFHTISFTQSHGPCSVCFTQRFGGLRRGAEGDQIFICLKKEEELLLFSTTNWTIANLSVDSFNIETCTSSLLGDFQAEWMFHTHTCTHARTHHDKNEHATEQANSWCNRKGRGQFFFFFSLILMGIKMLHPTSGGYILINYLFILLLGIIWPYCICSAVHGERWVCVCASVCVCVGDASDACL